MADAPKSGGGGWTALEIIVVLILAIGLLDRLTGRTEPPVDTGNNTATKTTITTQNYDDPYCGLTVTSPKPKASITNSLSLIGKVSGCNWNTDGTTALNAQIIDANGLPLSEYIPVPITTTTSTAANFGSVIALTVPAPTHTGTLILIPAVQGSKTQSVRIPLTFK